MISYAAEYAFGRRGRIALTISRDTGEGPGRRRRRGIPPHGFGSRAR